LFDLSISDFVIQLKQINIAAASHRPLLVREWKEKEHGKHTDHEEAHI
jgi:hypothetical protein